MQARRTNGAWWRPLACLVSAAALAGCAGQGRLVSQATEANLAQEEISNKLLLLNVARAAARQPMHFSKVTALRSANSALLPGFSLQVPFDPKADNASALGATLALQQPSLDIAPLDSQSFVRGITSPVSETLLMFFLDQGWPQELVLHVMVERVEILQLCKEKGKPTGCASESDVLSVARYDNVPESKADFQRFQSIVEDLGKCQILSGEGKGDAFGPPLPAATLAAQPRVLAELKSAGLTLAEAKGGGDELRKTPSAPSFEARLPAPDIWLLVKRAPADGTHSKQQPCELPVIEKRKEVRAGAGQNKAGAEKGALPSLAAYLHGREASRLGVHSKTKQESMAEYRVLFNLRSPEAMIYYLGELVRAQHIDGQWSDDSRREGRRVNVLIRVGRPTSSKCAWLFRAMQDADGQASRADCQDSLPAPSNGPTVVSVTYQGRTFAISGGSYTDRSMQTLSLVSQVVQLQQDASAIPATTTLRLLPP
jgi:hypothetical protein